MIIALTIAYCYQLMLIGTRMLHAKENGEAQRCDKFELV
jgi:hypothetical protein